MFDTKDIHVHVPEGATPKDGPSAGIAMATAITSIMTGIPVRRDIAMTGEVTLRGRVLPIGGLKEKLLAALRGGIKKVLIPQDNAKDLVDLPDSVKNGLEIVPVSRMDEVLSHALIRLPEAIEWDEAAEAAKGRHRRPQGRWRRPDDALRSVQPQRPIPAPVAGWGFFLGRPIASSGFTGEGAQAASARGGCALQLYLARGSAFVLTRSPLREPRRLQRHLGG